MPAPAARCSAPAPTSAPPNSDRPDHGAVINDRISSELRGDQHRLVGLRQSPSHMDDGVPALQVMLALTAGPGLSQFPPPAAFILANDLLPVSVYTRRAAPPSSVLAKMANLDGSRSHGGKCDVLAGATLREDPVHFAHIYRVLLRAARAEGIDRYSLPDFLDLEDGREFALLGQDELGTSVFENALRDQIARSAEGSDRPERETERIILAAARAGQHMFALNVLNNCGRRCVFCGLNSSAFGAKRMLLAGHIKPWKDSSPTERLDPQNGLAACPSHDVAFDTGLLTVSVDLKIHIAPSLADAVRGDPLTRQYYGRPPLLETLLLPDDAQPPARKYLDWHGEKIFAA
jgi:putative restriction endonuclease